TDAAQQAAFVAQRVLALREEGPNLNEVAVLNRPPFHALELQLKLTRRNIPFSITSGTRFFEQAHVKDIAAYLKLVSNPRDELAFKRLARLLPGVGARNADKLWQVFAGELRATGPVSDGAAGPSNVTRDTRHAIGPILERCAQAVASDSEQLRLSTIHQVKGLEFAVVFIIMLCEGSFPSARSQKNPDDVEEERRLFYVAITRAKNELYLSYPLVRSTQGKGGSGIQRPSGFLNEIPADLRDEWNLPPLNAYG